ncbi:MAG: RNA polymerase sigma factor [Candidatus Geothermincolia bacterium]
MERFESLVEDAICGNREAYGALYDLLFDEIYKYISWSVDRPQDAEDLTEEVFLRALRAIGHLEEGATISKAWFYRIARNMVIDHHRRRGRRREIGLDSVAESENPPGAHDQGLEQGWEREETRQMVRQAMEQLNEEQRQVIVLKYFSGFSNAEVGQVLGKREGAVNAMQYRALRRMERVLRRQGWESAEGYE